MSVFIKGTFKQLERFAKEAGVTAPDPERSTQVNLNLMSRNKDTMMYAFSRVFDTSIYRPPRVIVMKKVDNDLVDIYRTLLVKCQA